MSDTRYCHTMLDVASQTSTTRIGDMLDLRDPTFVIVGFWNQAILSEPAWIAKEILGVAVGQQIEVGQLAIEGQPSKIISLYDGFGLACLSERLEIYIASMAQKERAYEAISTIANKLPFTPVASLGLNLTVHLPDSTPIAGLIETGEDLSIIGRRREAIRTDSFTLDGQSQIEGVSGPILNWTRRTNFSAARLEFNYHHDLSDLKSIVPWMKSDPVERLRNNAFAASRGVLGVDLEDVQELSLWGK